jgi:hypothetical protein
MQRHARSCFICSSSKSIKSTYVAQPPAGKLLGPCCLDVRPGVLVSNLFTDCVYSTVYRVLAPIQFVQGASFWLKKDRLSIGLITGANPYYVSLAPSDAELCKVRPGASWYIPFTYVIIIAHAGPSTAGAASASTR